MGEIYGMLDFLIPKEFQAKKLSILKRAKWEDWQTKFFLISSIGIIIMKKEDSNQIDVYEHRSFEVNPVEDGTYTRSHCIEIIPKTS